MRAFPEVFVPVLALDPVREAYAMPYVRGDLTVASIETGIAKLKKLWAHPIPMGFRASVGIQEYYRYCQRLEAPAKIKLALELCYEDVRQGRHDSLDASVSYVHGDATLENLLPSGDWIDPNTRRVPALRELDGAKMIQSLMGYHGEIPPAVADVVRKFLREMNPSLLHFFFTSHVMRLCRHQPEKAEWVYALSVRGALGPNSFPWENLS